MEELKDSITKETNPIHFEWCDSNTLVVGKNNQLMPSGTCILLNGHIFFLHPLTTDQLQEFKKVVNEAITHEISKRPIQ